MDMDTSNPPQPPELEIEPAGEANTPVIMEPVIAPESPVLDVK